MFNPTGITTLVFDLGGVIIDLAPERTVEAFVKLSGKQPTEVAQAYSKHPMFFDLETGKTDEATFRHAVREVFRVQAEDAEIDGCWNAMLVDLPPQRLTMLNMLKKHFKVLALSNTNSIHIRYVNDVLLQGERLDDYFHHAHYSHHMNMRKPNADIYEQMLKTHHLTEG
jgi:glucose-1-phosphatase